MNINSQNNNIVTNNTIKTLKEDWDKYRVQAQNLLNKISMTVKEEESILARVRRLELLEDSASKYTKDREDYNEDKALAYAMMKNHREILEVGNTRRLCEEYQRITTALEADYKNAYIFINNFRAMFFDEITYTFAFETDGTVYQAHITEKELLPLLQLDINHHSKNFEQMFKLKINTSKELLKQLLKTVSDMQQKTQEDKEYLTSLEILDTSEENPLWQTIINHRGKGSMGNRYEVYRSILSQFSSMDEVYKKYTDSKKLSRYISSELKKARKNNISWTRGGDVGTVQVKYMNASVTSGTTLINTLTIMINQIFNKDLNTEKKDIAATIAKTFGEGTNFSKKNLSAAEKRALAAIEKEVHAKLDLL